MNYEIDKQSACPMYLQIYRAVKREIEWGGLRHGELIPAEDELARRFGVSRVTVRNALLKLTEEKYLRRKRGFGTVVSYKPAAERDERAIAVLVVDITRPLFAEMVKGIQDRLDEEHYKLILCDTENIADKEQDYLLRYEHEVAGFIVAPVTGADNHSHFQRLLQRHTPLVFVDRYLPEFSTDAVISDHRRGGYLAMRHLLKLGHRQIAILSEPEASSLTERIEGAKQAVEEDDLSWNPELVFRGSERGYSNGRDAIGPIIAEHPDVTAAFCLNDDIAWGCLNGLVELGLQVPEDFSVVGFDNLDHSAQFALPLTTVHQPKAEVGRAAADRLLGRIQRKVEGPAEVMRLPVELVVRSTTAQVGGEMLVKTESE